MGADNVQVHFWCHVLSVLGNGARFWWVGWGGVGGLITFKYTSTHTSCYATARCNTNSILYTDVCQGWRKAAKTSYSMKRFSVRSVVHKKSEWTKKCKVKGKAKLAGTQVLDRSWMWLKKFVPHALKNRYDKVINPRLWEYIYQFVYRHNQKD